MSRRQKEIKLLSGIPCVIQEMTGEAEYFLTNTKNTAKNRGLDLLLADCIVSLGDRKGISEKDAQRMLAFDRKKALVEIRQLSNDYDPSFKFSFEWPMEGGLKQKFDYDVEFTEENFKSRPYKSQWNSMEEIEKNVDFTLPGSGIEMRWTMLDGEKEGKISDIAEEHRSSHTLIQLRNPRVVTKENGKEVHDNIQLNLKQLSWADLNALRKNILETEGDMDTFLVIEHPKTKKTTRVDLISVPAFFFPSLGL